MNRTGSIAMSVPELLLRNAELAWGRAPGLANAPESAPEF